MLQQSNTNPAFLIKDKIELLIKLFILNYYNTSSLIHYWKESTLTIYNPTHQTKFTINLPTTVLSDAESISYNSFIYIIGGDYTSNVTQIYAPKKIISMKAPMFTPKYRHSLCRCNQYIYSLGGYDKYESINDCQMYNAVKNQWVQLPNLITARSYSAAFTFKSKYTFCMYGINISKENCLEKLDIPNHTKWEHVVILNPTSERSKVHGIEINEMQVLIFGGYNKNKVSECFALDIGDTVRVIKCVDMATPTCFYNCSVPFKNGRKIYAVDYYRRIHIFEKNKWNLIK